MRRNATSLRNKPNAWDEIQEVPSPIHKHVSFSTPADSLRRAGRRHIDPLSDEQLACQAEELSLIVDMERWRVRFLVPDVRDEALPIWFQSKKSHNPIEPMKRKASEALDAVITDRCLIGSVNWKMEGSPWSAIISTSLPPCITSFSSDNSSNRATLSKDSPTESSNVLPSNWYSPMLYQTKRSMKAHQSPKLNLTLARTKQQWPPETSSTRKGNIGISSHNYKMTDVSCSCRHTARLISYVWKSCHQNVCL